MGRSWSFTTIQAASNCRMSSSCPTHWTASSSGWARCKLTPSISTVISYHHYAHNGMLTTGDLGRGSGDASDHDSMHLNQQLDFLPRNLERCRNPFRRVACAMHAQCLGALAQVQPCLRQRVSDILAGLLLKVLNLGGDLFNSLAQYLNLGHKLRLSVEDAIVG